MAKQDSWGIEVGANALKAVRLVKEKDEVKVVDYDVLPFKKVLTTPDINADDAIQVNLDQFLSRHDVNKSTVVVSVPGHMAFSRFAKLPPVDPKKIPEIVKFEAVQQIPFPIGQVVWDYQVFQEEDSPDVEVGIFAITKERILEFLNNYRSVGMDVHGVSVSPLSVYNAMAFDMGLDEESEGVIFMDIGTTATDLIIVESGRIWMRTLAIGGNTFTDALVKSFKLSFPKAEKLKREAGTSKYARQIFQAMRPVFADLVQEMQRSLGFYQSLNRDAELSKVVGVGSTFKLPGLIKFLKQQLQMDVNRPDGFEKISVEGKQEADFAEHAVNLATAYGLALQGIEEERVHANLLPVHITKARIWKKKQPWFGVAAGCMLAATGAAAYKLSADKSIYEESLEKSKTIVDRVKKKGNDIKTRLSNVSTKDPRHRIENLRRIIDYRDIWPKLMEDLSFATRSFSPQPVLLTTDYEGIQKIPRERRRHMIFESITAQYRLRTSAKAPDKASGPKSNKTTDINKIWDAFKPDDAAPATGTDAGADPGGLEPIRRTDAPEVKAQKGPEFVITITGYTPYGDGLRQIDEKFLKWLKEHHEQIDRPYRIVATDESILSIKRAGAQKKDGQGGGGARGAGPAKKKEPEAGGNGGLIPGIVPGIVPGKKPLIGAKAKDPNKKDEAEQQVEAEIPTRPTASEPTANDWVFTVQFSVQVLRPEVVRQREAQAIERQKERESQAELLDELKNKPPEGDKKPDGDDADTKTDPATKEDDK